MRFTLSVDAKRASKNSNKTRARVQKKKGVKKVVARNSAVICLITMWCFCKRLVKQEFNGRFFVLGAMQLFIIMRIYALRI